MVQQRSYGWLFHQHASGACGSKATRLLRAACGRFCICGTAFRRVSSVLYLCRATSILASTEDARLEALRSLTAAVAVAFRGSGQPPAGLPLVSAAVDALSRALLPILAPAAKGQGDAAGIAFSWLSSSMAAAAEISQVLAPCMSKHSMARYMLSVHVRDGPGSGCCECLVMDACCCLFSCIQPGARAMLLGM